MKRKELLKRLRQIAKVSNATLTTKEGGNHTKILFDDQVVTLVGRHNDVPEHTARGAIRDAEKWAPPKPPEGEDDRE